MSLTISPNRRSYDQAEWQFQLHALGQHCMPQQGERLVGGCGSNPYAATGHDLQPIKTLNERKDGCNTWEMSIQRWVHVVLGCFGQVRSAPLPLPPIDIQQEESSHVPIIS